MSSSNRSGVRKHLVATLVGSLYGPNGAEPDSFPQRPSVAGLAELVQAASRRAPGLAGPSEVASARRRSGGG